MTARRQSRAKPAAPKYLAPTNARELAFVILSEHKSSGRLIAPLFEQHSRSGSLSSADRGLASEIVYGIVRRQTTLNFVLQQQIDRPRHRVEGELWTLLQIGAYQLIFLDSVPAHAAVNETVNVARRIGNSRWSGFLNGVLRAVARELTNESIDAPAADAVPVTAGRYRRLSQPVFADPDESHREYVAQAFSFPEWLIERWQTRFDPDELLRICFWFNGRAPISLRVNLLRTSRDKLLAAFDSAGIAASAGPLPEAVQLEDSMRIEMLPGFREGWFCVQDSSAMQAAALLDPHRGERVLDLCAAPGTKTTHLAERMHDEGVIVATDVSADRLKLVNENCERLGLGCVEPRQIAPDGSDLPDGPFDAALVDVPCSNTGVLGKRPEARWRIKPQDVRELPSLQFRLLCDACDRVREGGRVLYSTCSIEAEENEQVVHQLRKSRPHIQISQSLTHTPGKPADGGYQAILYIGSEES